MGGIYLLPALSALAPSSSSPSMTWLARRSFPPAVVRLRIGISSCADGCGRTGVLLLALHWIRPAPRSTPVFLHARKAAAGGLWEFQHPIRGSGCGKTSPPTLQDPCRAKKCINTVSTGRRQCCLRPQPRAPCRGRKRIRSGSAKSRAASSNVRPSSAANTATSWLRENGSPNRWPPIPRAGQAAIRGAAGVEVSHDQRNRKPPQGKDRLGCQVRPRLREDRPVRSKRHSRSIISSSVEVPSSVIIIRSPICLVLSPKSDPHLNQTSQSFPSN